MNAAVIDTPMGEMTVIRAEARAWYERQVESSSKSHGTAWTKNCSWVEAYLKEELRQRLIALGWRLK